METDINKELSLEAFCAVLLDKLNHENKYHASRWLMSDKETKKEKMKIAFKAYNDWYINELNSAKLSDLG